MRESMRGAQSAIFVCLALMTPTEHPLCTWDDWFLGCHQLLSSTTLVPMNKVVMVAVLKALHGPNNMDFLSLWNSLVAQTVKASVYNVGDPGLIPGSGRSAGEGNGNLLQYYCLENPMDRGAW